MNEVLPDYRETSTRMPAFAPRSRPGDQIGALPWFGGIAMTTAADTNGVRARLYRSDDRDEDVDLSALAKLSPAKDELLWVDLQDPAEDCLREVCASLGMHPDAVEDFSGPSTMPGLGKSADQFWLRVVPVTDDDGLNSQGPLLLIAAGTNWVVSVHREPIGFIDELRKRERMDSDLGGLSAESFVAALLDWHLSTYFAAFAEFEIAVERMEVGILSDRPRDCLPELRVLRKAASRLRRMLAPHRAVFGALSRPDFRPADDGVAARHFASLDTRYERAMDMVENARELVIGSFELLTSRTGIDTNQSMRTLTFVTVVTGVLAVIAGVLGMNFDASFFDTRDVGFAIAAGVMLVLAGIALWFGRRRAWF